MQTLFNTYFLTIADKISSNNINADNAKLNNYYLLLIHYLIQAFEHHFPNIKFNYVSTTEIKKND